MKYMDIISVPASLKNITKEIDKNGNNIQTEIKNMHEIIDDNGRDICEEIDLMRGVVDVHGANISRELHEARMMFEKELRAVKKSIQKYGIVVLAINVVMKIIFKS
jgi:hypothetical protein